MVEQRSLLLLLFATAVYGCGPDQNLLPNRLTSLVNSLQNIINESAQLENISYSFAVQTAEFGVTVFAGVDNRQSGLPVTADSLYPLGSLTKSFTATAVMRQSEAGLLDLDMPVFKILDPWLDNQGLPEMVALWNGDTTIELVTSRHLLGMQAGLGDSF